MSDKTKVVPFKVLENKIQEKVEEEKDEDLYSNEELFKMATDDNLDQILIVGISHDTGAMNTYHNIGNGRDLHWYLSVLMHDMLERN